MVPNNVITSFGRGFLLSLGSASCRLTLSSWHSWMGLEVICFHLCNLFCLNLLFVVEHIWWSVSGNHTFIRSEWSILNNDRLIHDQTAIWIKPLNILNVVDLTLEKSQVIS